MRDENRAHPRPTLKTGRGYGHGKKNRPSRGFSLLDTFRAHSHDIVAVYATEDHQERPELNEARYSPKHVDSLDKVGALKRNTGRGLSG